MSSIALEGELEFEEKNRVRHTMQVHHVEGQSGVFYLLHRLRLHHCMHIEFCQVIMQLVMQGLEA